MADNNQNNDPQENKQQSYPEAEPASQGQKKAVKVILIVIAVLVVLGIIIVALLAFALPKIGENIVEDVTNTEVQRDGDDNISFESDDGSSYSIGADLPDDFPENVPLFEPAELTSSTSISSSEDSRSWTASFVTDASRDEVVSFYEDEFSDSEWKVESTFSDGDSSQTRYVNEAEQTRVNVLVQEADEDEGTTGLTLSIRQFEE